VVVDTETWSINIPVDESSKSTMPVGVAAPEFLVIPPVKVTLAPIVDKDGPANVTVVPMRLGDAHLASKFVTFTVPNPVAKSYPATALKAGVEPPVVVAMMPNCPEVVLLQLGLPPTQATELFPFVTS
jgi:hypothetical protein